MNDIRGKILAIAEKTVKKIAEREAAEWPPLCITRYYQPERPVRSAAEKGIED